MDQNKKQLIAFQSNYTLLHSALTIDFVISYAKKHGIQSALLVDTNVLTGMVEFYKKALAANIIPHIGLKIVYNDVHFIAIAKNNDGLTSLIKVSSLLKSKHAEFDHLLGKLHDVIIIFSDLPREFLQRLQTADNDIYKDANSGPSEKYPLLELPIANVSTSGNAVVLDVLYAIENGIVLTDIDERIIDPIGLTVVDKIPQILIQETVSLDFETPHLPSFTQDVAPNNTSYLQTLCRRGLQKRLNKQITTEYIDRLEYELEIIEEMGFIDYFLIIWDVMRFARSNDIIIGPGRGSAVGSLVAYVLGITMLDPLEYNLFFERFLNIERKSLPDIDIDVEDGRRGEVVQYLREKYQQDHVANIGTYGTFGARMAVRDVAKVYGIPAKRINEIVKQFKNQRASIATNISENKKLQQIIAQHPDIAQVLTVAQKIEGFPRHASVHAAGIIITNEPTNDYVPTYELEDGLFVTQIPMGDAESIGLLKIDFLGLRNLTIIRHIAEQIKPEGMRVVDFINQIPQDDQETFSMLSSGETTGIFQLESDGMRRVLRKFQITSFLDIATILALYRPGPMQFINEFIERKNNKKAYKVNLQVIENVLDETYGIMVYQEQVMKIAQVVGGMTLAQADMFRRAMSKKNKVLLEEQQTIFLSGAEKNNINIDEARKLFTEIMAFANYGFNKSHAIAYAQISYNMAYLKTHYTAIFMTELLNSVLNNEKKLYDYLLESMRFGIKILPPDVLKSQGGFTVEGNDIRMGLLAIKGLGKATIDPIMKERAHRQFTDLGDFISRFEVKEVNTANLQQLANGYAFSSFSKNQKAVHIFLKTYEEGRKFKGYGIPSDVPQDMDDYSLIERRQYELDAFGFSLYAHPLMGYPRNKHPLNVPMQKSAKYIVIIDNVKEITTKQGKKMAFVQISDLTHHADVVVFPDKYVQYQTFIQENKIVEMILIGQTNKKGEMTLSVLKVEPYFMR